VRVDVAQFRELPLEVHAILEDLSPKDVTAIDLPGGGEGRTLSDVRALAAIGELMSASPLSRALFGLRIWVGRLFGWDRPRHDPPEMSYISRVPTELQARSAVRPGTMESGFRLLYLVGRESLAEIRNATVHAFLCATLVERPSGYRLYWAVYVKPLSRLTPVYMALIEPFRRFIVYPAMLGRVRRAWTSRYPPVTSASDSAGAGAGSPQERGANP
jgi:Protein of unknown function (DUF2867)